MSSSGSNYDDSSVEYRVPRQARRGPQLKRQITHEPSNDAQFAGPFQEHSLFSGIFCPLHSQFQRSGTPKSVDQGLQELVKEHQESPAVLWFSFFSDLIYVCVIVKFTDQYKHFIAEEEINTENHAGHWFEVRLTIESLFFFLAFFTVWFELTQTKARFYDIPGALDDFLYFVYLIGIIIMAVQMDRDTYLLTNRLGFLIGFTVCMTVMYLLHFMYVAMISDARPYAIRRVRCYTLVLVLLYALLGLEFADLGSDTMDILTVCVVVFCCLLLIAIAMVSFKVNPLEANYTKEFFAMRFGILTMIIMGESILAMIIGDKGLGFAGASSSAYSQALHVEATHTTVVQTTTSKVIETTAEIIETTAAPVLTDATVAPDGSITADNVLQYLAQTSTSEIAVAGTVLNKHSYPVYDGSGAWFQHGGESNLDDYVFVFLAFGTIYLLKNLYFGSIGEAGAQSHEALEKQGSPGSVWWIAVHIPLFFCLICSGAGWRLLFTVIHEDHVYEGYVFLLVVSTALSLACMLLLRLAAGRSEVGGSLPTILRVLTILAVPTILICFAMKPISLAICMFSFVTLVWLYDLMYEEKESLHDDGFYENQRVLVDTIEDGWIPDHVEIGYIKKKMKDGKSYEIEFPRYPEHHDHKIMVIDEDFIRARPAWYQPCFETCGWEDKEYEGNFEGPNTEKSVLHLFRDVCSCAIWSDEAQPPRGMHVGSHHDHHAHKTKESGADHGLFGEFTDLLYVAVVIKFADQMKYKQTSMNLADENLVESDEEHFRIYMEAIVYFMCFFLTWLELTHCLLRFKNMPGIFDDVMYFFYLCGVVGMAININHLEYLTDRSEAFCLWFAFSQMCLVILHFQFSLINEAEEYCWTRIKLFTFTTALTIAAAFLENEECLIVLSIATLLALTVSVNSYRVFKKQVKSHHELHHYKERFGLILMICIGESILALVLVDFKKQFEFYAVMLIAFTTMYFIQQMYVESDCDNPKDHALSEGKIPGSITWVLMHGVCAYFLLCMGVGYKMILPHADEHHIGELERFTLCYSLFGVLGSLLVIRAAHEKFVLPTSTMITRFCVMLLLLACAHMIEDPMTTVGVCLAVTVISRVFDYVFMEFFKLEIKGSKYMDDSENTEPLLNSVEKSSTLSYDSNS